MYIFYTYKIEKMYVKMYMCMLLIRKKNWKIL